MIESPVRICIWNMTNDIISIAIRENIHSDVNHKVSREMWSIVYDRIILVRGFLR